MKTVFKITLLTKAIIILLSIQSFGQCQISNLVVTNSDCNASDMVDVIVDFDHIEEGNQGFTILGNGVNYGNFMYSSLPVTLPGILGNCDTEYEFIIRDIFDPTCSVFTEYGTICCIESCDIEINSVMPSVCVDDHFLLSLNVTENSIGELVDIFLNETIFTQLEITDTILTLENISTSVAGQNQITICNAMDNTCCSTIEFLNPCECATTNITTEIVDCSSLDSSYYVIVDFDYVATSDSFQMGGDNNFLGVFAYADLPVLAGPISWSDDEAEILIVDQNNIFCFSIAYLGIVNDCDINCQIFNVFAESYDCENGVYFMDIEFETEDVQSSTFDVFVDGINYGSFLYGENFYTVGPIDQNCDSPPILVIQDSENNQCSDFFNFDEPICCAPPCEFSSFEASAICNDTEEITITFSYDNPSTTTDDQFFILFNGIEYGPYEGPAGENSIILSGVANGLYPISILVGGNASCIADTTVVIDCQSIECLISDPFAETYECEDGAFLVDITFDSVGTSDSFEIRGNGQSYGIYSYGEAFYTVGPLQGDCVTLYEFVIIDQGEQSCSAVYEFIEPICCESCEIGDLEISLLDCQEEVYTISLNFDYEDSSDNFILSYDSETQMYAYSELPIEVDNLPIDTDIQFTVSSTTDSLCSSSVSYYLETCLDAVTDFDLSDMNISQNPSNITISNTTDLDTEVILVNISGNIVFKSPLNRRSHTVIAKDNLSDGIYLLSFINNDKVNTKKVFILD